MKQKYVLCALGLAALLLGGCAAQQSQLSRIGSEQAKKAALDASGLSGMEVTGSGVALADKNGMEYYQVSFTAGGQTYQYDIDALTGVVISLWTETAGPQAAPGETAAPPPAETAQPGTGPVTGPTLSPAEALPAAGQGSPAPGQMLTMEEAKAIALEHAGVSDVTFVEGKLDYEDGRQVYEVEFYTGDWKEYDYEIDAYTGAVVSYDYDAEGYAPPPADGGTISQEEAKNLALAQVPGATARDIWKFGVDRDDGRMVYEGEIVYNGVEYEFEIDAYSGAIRSWEYELVGR